MADDINVGTSPEATPTATPAAPAAPAPTAAPTNQSTPAASPTAPAAPANPAAPSTPIPSEEPVVGPDDWAAVRTRIAKGDEKLEKRLARYTSVDSMAEALIAAQNKIASGSLRSVLPSDATPEQLAEWRAENGIPEAPEAYDVALPDGLVIGEEDKPIVDEYLKAAHAANLTPQQVKTNLAWYFEQQEKQIEIQNQSDYNAKESGEEVLREVWGTEAKLNKNLVKGLIASAPGDVPDQILGARLADGTPLGSHPDTLRWLADIARQINPVATVVPGAGTNAAQAIETELAGLQEQMKDKTSNYWKGPTAEKLQQRYRDLITVQNKMK